MLLTQKDSSSTLVIHSIRDSGQLSLQNMGSGRVCLLHHCPGSSPGHQACIAVTSSSRLCWLLPWPLTSVLCLVTRATPSRQAGSWHTRLSRGESHQHPDFVPRSAVQAWPGEDRAACGRTLARGHRQDPKCAQGFLDSPQATATVVFVGPHRLQTDPADTSAGRQQIHLPESCKNTLSVLRLSAVYTLS